MRLSANQASDIYEGEGDYDYHYDWHRWQPLTVVTTVDANNPASPVAIDTQAFEGNLSSSRRSGSDL